MGLVGMHDFLQGNEDEKLLEMIELAVNDCLPLQIMCIKTIAQCFMMQKSWLHFTLCLTAFATLLALRK